MDVSGSTSTVQLFEEVSDFLILRDLHIRHDGIPVWKRNGEADGRRCGDDSAKETPATLWHRPTQEAREVLQDLTMNQDGGPWLVFDDLVSEPHRVSLGWSDFGAVTLSDRSDEVCNPI